MSAIRTTAQLFDLTTYVRNPLPRSVLLIALGGVTSMAMALGFNEALTSSAIDTGPLVAAHSRQTGFTAEWLFNTLVTNGNVGEAPTPVREMLLINFQYAAHISEWAFWLAQENNWLTEDIAQVLSSLPLGLGAFAAVGDVWRHYNV